MITKKQKEIVEKYVKQLKEIRDNYSDKEVLHYMSDDLLVSALVDLGFEEIALAYNKNEDIGFWYA